MDALELRRHEIDYKRRVLEAELRGEWDHSHRDARAHFRALLPLADYRRLLDRMALVTTDVRDARSRANRRRAA